MAKTVCIVGAGPSGLTAAKAFLHDAPAGSFNVIVFDRQPRIGGLWPLRRDDGDGLVHPMMVANQSRHTVQFSDLAWEGDAPQLPRAWQVGQYLERYRRKYCQGASIRLGEAVEKAELVDGAWVVETRSSCGELVSHVFDFLLVAGGFFASPLVPPALKDMADTAGVPVVYGTKFGDVKQLLSKTAGTGRNILVVGGQMSGVETAATIASQLASEVNAPGRSDIPNVDKYMVHHLIQRPIWIFPLLTSPDHDRPDPPFLPLDLTSWDLAKRETPLTNRHGLMPPETARVLHDFFEASVCGNQSTLSPALAVGDTERDKAAYLAVSNSYAEFVRSGLITVSRGRLASMSGHVAAVSVTEPKDTNSIDDVAAVLLATGFSATSSVSYLPSWVHDTLSASAEDHNHLFALAFHGTHHPAVPNLGFVGFYRSPFWGVMELQARFVMELWLAGGPASPSLNPAMAAALKNDTSIDQVMAIRRADAPQHISQFPMGDYPWLMQELAAAQDLPRVPHLSPMPVVAGKQMDILTPARYPAKTMDDDQRAEWRTSLRQTEDTVRQGFGGKFVAGAVFRSLQGAWAMHRDIQSKRPDMPSGTFSGTAEFRRRAGTADGRLAAFDPRDAGSEYLYVESGVFTTTTGHVFPTTRRYVYRYDEHTDTLSAWFVRTDDRERADYLFHRLRFDAPAEESTAWTAASEHLCVEDNYVVQYAFVFDAVNLTDWTVRYQVDGPKKDYCMRTKYARPAWSASP